MKIKITKKQRIGILLGGAIGLILSFLFGFKEIISIGAFIPSFLILGNFIVRFLVQQGVNITIDTVVGLSILFTTIIYTILGFIIAKLIYKNK